MNQIRTSHTCNWCLLVNHAEAGRLPLGWSTDHDDPARPTYCGKCTGERIASGVTA